jgi:hypothetical protein
MSEFKPKKINRVKTTGSDFVPEDKIIKDQKVAEEESITDNSPDEEEVDLDWLISKIVQYCEAQSAKKLYPYQIEFAERIVESIILNDGEELTALFSRQSGKTETIADIMSGLMVILPRLAQFPKFEPYLGQFKEGLWIGLFAPSAEQAFTTFSRTRDRIRSKNAQMILNDPEINTKLDKEANPMMLSNGSLMRMHSAAKQSQIESKTYHILILEECQDIDKQKTLKSIHPMGASTNATIIKVGTPNTKRCEFLETILRNKRQDLNLRGRRRNHFEFDYRICQKYNPRYKKYIEKEKARYGEDSDFFRMSYKLEWILDRGMFMSEQMFEDMLNKGIKHEDTCAKYCVAGIDLGKKHDSTIVTVGWVDRSSMIEDQATGAMKAINKEVLNWLELQGDDYESQYHEILDFLKNYNIKCIFVDATGVGTPIADRLIYGFENIADVIPYEFTTTTKSEMWKNLQTEIRAGRLKVPYHAKTQKLRTFRKFYQQMQDLEKEYKGQNLVCQHPQDDKDAHDDYCDSLALFALAADYDSMSTVEMTDNDIYERRR